MPLPEHEQRQLQQIEQALYRDDPKFGRRMRASDPRMRYGRKLLQALLGVVIGAGLLAAGAVTHRVYLDAAGVVIVLLSLVWAVVSWRRNVARSGARSRARTKTATGTKARARADLAGPDDGAKADRWRRRRQGNGEGARADPELIPG